MPKEPKPVVISKSDYIANVFGGLAILTTTLPSGAVAGYGLLFYNYKGYFSAFLLTIGIIAAVWCFIAAPWIAIAAYRRARAIRLAKKAAGGWPKVPVTDSEVAKDA